jgi:hypothetical protein
MGQVLKLALDACYVAFLVGLAAYLASGRPRR